MKSINTPYSKNLVPARPLKTANTSNSSRDSSFEDTQQSQMPVLISQTLRPGTTHQVIVSHVETGPKKFFIQLTRNQLKLHTMMEEINKAKLSPLSRNPLIGMAVIARHALDRRLYRAVIQNIMHDDCQVFFVDFGFIQMVSVDDIFDIPSQFLEYKTFSMGFCLSKLKAIHFDSEVDRIFRDLVSDIQLIMLVVPMESASFVQTCQLTYGNPEQNVYEQLVQRTMPMILKYPPSIEFSEKDTENVVIRYIESTKSFFVQPTNLNQVCDDMYRKMSSETDKKVQQLKVLKVGDPCCLFYNEEWYRGEITQISLPNVKVKLIDYGNTVTVARDCVRHLPNVLVNYAPMVVQCCLAGFQDLEPDENSTTQIEMLAESDEGCRNVFKMQVTGKKHGIYLVNLYDQSKSPVLDVAKRLLQLKKPVVFQKQHKIMNSTLINAQRDDDLTLTKDELSTNPSTEYSNSYQARVLDLTNTSGIDTGIVEDISLDFDAQRLRGQTIKLKSNEIIDNDNIYVTLCGYDTKFKCKIPAEQKPKSTTFAGRIENVLEDNTLVVKPVTSNSTRILNMPIVNNHQNVLIGYAEGIDSIYVRNEKWEPALSKLLDDMYEFYETGGLPFTDLTVKDLCAAKSSIDGNWYRAQVSFIHGIDSVQVFYLDYGNQECLEDVNNIRQLEETFLELDALAQRVYLPLRKKSRSDDLTSTDLLNELRELAKEGVMAKLNILDFFEDKWIADIEIDNINCVNHIISKFPTMERVAARELFEHESHKVPEPTKPKIVSEQSQNKTAEKGLALISHVDSPNQFFIHMKNDIDRLDELQSDLQIIATQLVSLNDFSVNTKCLAKYAVDDCWYRAKIIDSHDDIIVEFIDYGNKDIIPKNKRNELKQIPECYLKAPPFAHQVSLLVGPPIAESATTFLNDLIDAVEVEFVGSMEKDQVFVRILSNGQDIAEQMVAKGEAVQWSWVNSGQNCFTSHIESINEFYIQFEKDITLCEMMATHLENEDNFTVLNDPAIGSYCVAKYEDGLWYRAKIQGLSNNGFDVFFVDFGNTYHTTEVKKMNEELAKQKSLCTKCSLKLPNNIKAWSPEAETKFQELASFGETIFKVYSMNLGTTTTVELFLNEKNIVEQLLPQHEKDELNSSVYSNDDKLGLRMPAVISHVNGPHDFYVHLEKQGIQDLEEYLVNNVNQLIPLPASEVKLEIPIIFGLNNTFYRGKIIEIKENLSLEVMATDYGWCAEVENVMRMPEQLENIDSLALQVCLEGFKNQQDQQGYLKKFLRLVSTNNQYTIEIVGHRENRTVIRLFTENGCNIAEKLILPGN